jgi:hypothetical protein
LPMRQPENDVVTEAKSPRRIAESRSQVNEGAF